MAFDYAAFLSGKTGAAWLADGAHYTDVGRTVAANVDDSIASASDQGAVFHASQSSTNLQPTLRDEGGKRYFEHAGDYWIAGTNADWNFLHRAAATDAYICAAVRFGTVADPNTIYGVLGTQQGAQSQVGALLFYDDRSSSSLDRQVRAYVARGGAVTLDLRSPAGTLAGGVDAIVEWIKVGGFWRIFVNYAEVAQNNVSGESTANSHGALHIGAGSGGGSSLVGRIYGAVICNAEPSIDERGSIVSDMNARCVMPPLQIISGNATKSGAGGIDAVVARRWDTHENIISVQPAANGDWNLALPNENLSYDLTYFADGCQPICHGPYAITAI